MLTQSRARIVPASRIAALPVCGAQEVAQRRLEVARPGRPPGQRPDGSLAVPVLRLSVDRDLAGGHDQSD